MSENHVRFDPSPSQFLWKIGQNGDVKEEKWKKIEEVAGPILIGGRVHWLNL